MRTGELSRHGLLQILSEKFQAVKVEADVVAGRFLPNFSSLLYTLTGRCGLRREEEPEEQTMLVRGGGGGGIYLWRPPPLRNRPARIRPARTRPAASVLSGGLLDTKDWIASQRCLVAWTGCPLRIC